jgi:hypothetical protein
MNSTWDNAEQVWQEFLHEKAGVWYISDEFGFKIMIKASSAAIRSIIKGCQLEFVFGKDSQTSKPVIHNGLKIYDDATHFINISGTHRNEREHNSLLRVIKNEIIPVQFYNEMTVCVATTEISFDLQSRTKILKLLGKKEELYVGPFDERINKSLDCFVHTIDKSQQLEDVHEIETVSISGTFNKWQMMENHFVGVNDKSKIIINDTNEGDVLEKQVWAALESLFDHDIYLRPQAAHKKATRELTDILAYSDYGIFLVETKALGILNNENERDMTRKVAGIQKQVEKGIDQLAGAVKKIRAKETIFDANGNEIRFDRSLLPHCVVLVSDLLSFYDWKPIMIKMFQTMIDVPMQLHLMDLLELMRYIGYSKKSKYMFDYLLMERTKELVKHETIHIRLHGPNDVNFDKKGSGA